MTTRTPLPALDPAGKPWDEAVLHGIGSGMIFTGPDITGVEIENAIDLSGYAAALAVKVQADLVAYAATKRYAVETGGIVVGGAKVATDRDSQGMIGNAFAYVTASGAASVRFKAASGWIALSADQVKALALAVGAHVQAAFAAEDDLDAAINANPPTVTTFAQIDAAPWPANA
ncbi:DUF4376 domain-containing protein [Methylobacterium sp. D48H]